MRGNHSFLGRQDYTEPKPLAAAELLALQAVHVMPTAGRTTWNTVLLDGSVIGYVTTRLSGQYYRTPDMREWMFAASDWNSTDPQHGQAIFALLKCRKVLPTTSAYKF